MKGIVGWTLGAVSVFVSGMLLYGATLASLGYFYASLYSELSHQVQQGHSIDELRHNERLRILLREDSSELTALYDVFGMVNTGKFDRAQTRLEDSVVSNSETVSKLKESLKTPESTDTTQIVALLNEAILERSRPRVDRKIGLFYGAVKELSKHFGWDLPPLDSKSV